MATGTKTRNPDRKNGKAWGKNHDKVTSAKTKPEKEKKAKSPRHPRGSSITWPKITWEWAMESVSGRHTGTRRFRLIDECIRRRPEIISAEVEPNPEAKPLKKSEK